MNSPLATLASRMGILPSYVGLDGKIHNTNPDTQSALLAAMSVEATTAKTAQDFLNKLDAEEARKTRFGWRVVTAGTAPKLNVGSDETWNLQLENGQELEGRGSQSLPKLPLGRHRLTFSSRTIWLLSAPSRLPEPPRAWGVTGPLAGLRSPAEGGIGDYNDLGKAALEAAQKGAAFFGINPIHAGFPADDTTFSPYSPSHRQWLNSLHIATSVAAVSTGALIDYRAEAHAHHAALRSQYEAASDTRAFEVFLVEKGDDLHRFATHQTLSGMFGPYWNTWPKALQNATGPEVDRVAKDFAHEVRFHAWVQYQADTQLSRVTTQLTAAEMPFGLYLDLAVGTHPFGAETWENPILFAAGASLGAPPDAFSRDGQTWNLAPFVPHAMEAEGFATFAAILRRQFQFAKLIRIDHILGFDRAFWSTGDPDVPGAYVNMPLEALLAVTRIEATRAGATVIGEDLGNIPSGLRSALKDSGMLGCRIIAFEHDVHDGGEFTPALAYDQQSLASFSTHDLPTWRGWRKGADIDARHEIGQIHKDRKSAALAERANEVAAFDAVAKPQGMHEFLADSASQLVAVQLENVFEMEDQPNLPGTTVEYPNWRRRLPIPVSEYATDPRLDEISKIMDISGRKSPS